MTKVSLFNLITSFSFSSPLLGCWIFILFLFQISTSHILSVNIISLILLEKCHQIMLIFYLDCVEFLSVPHFQFSWIALIRCRLEILEIYQIDIDISKMCFLLKMQIVWTIYANDIN